MLKVSLIVLAALTVISAGCAEYPCEYNRHVTGGETAASQQNQKSHGITYVSEHGKILTAYFDTLAATVLVKLPDGREILLPQAISASGAQYSNGFETFWEHHGEGSFLIGDTVIFRGTVAADQTTSGKDTYLNRKSKF